MIKAKILVAEDNEINQKVLIAILKKGGYEYALVQNGIEVVDHFLKGDFDLILMDCQMPEVDGLQASKKIRQMEQQLKMPRKPIIALTANAMIGDRELCIQAGMDDFLPKPFHHQQLLLMIEKWLLENNKGDLSNVTTIIK